MKLNLAVEGRVLASVPVDASSIKNDYYLKAFRRLLTLRHQKLLATIKNEPVFYLEDASTTKAGPVREQVFGY